MFVKPEAGRFCPRARQKWDDSGHLVVGDVGFGRVFIADTCAYLQKGEFLINLLGDSSKCMSSLC